ncbi:MAG: 2-oxoacid:acceptor oxidoreductase, gamma subunit, pyruvate/2-ketoisovalerate [Moorella sp. 60_41]|nr:MAG: 2-oxoacid:acceptor oxidoreductase, gamma subunit, pyruvate/2-ketoisovalerate [Moorella sp. 60_41]
MLNPQGNLKIVLAGEGGQGVQTVAEIMAEAAFRSGYQALYIPSFGVEQRGGVSLAFVQVGRQPIGAPVFYTADLVGAFSLRAVKKIGGYLGDETWLFYDAHLEEEVKELYPSLERRVAIPALEVAREEMHPRVFNVVILGALGEATGLLPREAVTEALERQLGHKFAQDPSLREMNYRALERGQELCRLALAGEGAAGGQGEVRRGPGGERGPEKADRGRGGLVPGSLEPIITEDGQGRFYLYPALCKGCGLCIEKCPVRTIGWARQLGALGTPVVEPGHGEPCIACRQCQLVCPDCAIWIERRDGDKP